MKRGITLTDLVDILKFILENGSWGLVIILIGVIVYFIINPDKVEKWSSMLARMFSFLGKNIEKQYISKDIQFKINSYGKEMNKECNDLVPYKTEIKFINPSVFKKESCQHVKEKVIIFMKDRHNQDENFIIAAMLSTEKTLIPNSRIYVEKNLMKSVDLQFVKNLIVSKNKSILNSYVDKYFSPEIQKKKVLNENVQILEKMTERGIFTRILLQELKSYGVNFYPRSTNQMITKETKAFFKSLKELAYKKPQEDVNLQFNGSFIKVSFILIGISSRVFTLRGINTDPYKQRAFICEDDGIKTIYILAWGVNTIAAKKLAEILALLPDRFEKASENEFKVKINDNKKIEAISIRFRILKNYEEYQSS